MTVMGELYCPLVVFVSYLAVKCYNCNTTASDVRGCTAKLCDDGQVCMKKELRSLRDGHTEYQLSCDTKQHCDGEMLPLAFGRRDIKSRDITISCCGSDLCNNPSQVCRKDVIVVFDDSARPHVLASDIKAFLEYLASNLDIGQHGVLMSLAMFDRNSSHTVWHLDSNTDQHSLINAIRITDFSRNHTESDLNEALRYLVNSRSYHDDRALADDVIIILTSHDDKKSSHFIDLTHQLREKYSNVIVIGITRHVSTSDLLPVATDAAHEFNGMHSSYLSQIQQNVVSLICT